MGSRAAAGAVLGLALALVSCPCRAAADVLPGATAPVREIVGDVHVRDRVVWRNACYRVAGNIYLHRGGTLVVENARVELAAEYTRHYNWYWQGGRLVTRRATVGGSSRDGRVRQVNLELTDGLWQATDTAVTCIAGIVLGSGEARGRLRATRLIAGPHPDSIIMSGRGDVVVRDSEYAISLVADANRGPAAAVLDLPINTPITQVYDGRNIPGAQYRLTLVNTKVPLWFLFASGVTNNGPPVSLTFHRCPFLIPSVMGWNLKGAFRLPAPWPGDTKNASLTVGNLTLKTLDEPVGIYCWGLYLSGPETEVTISGQTLLCELMVFGGKCAVIGDEGSYNGATTATTVEVGAAGTADPAELTLRNTALGRFAKGDPVKGQITAKGNSRITIQHARCADLILITQDRGAITLGDIKREGIITTRQDGGAITVPAEKPAGG
jgi:hypothetical protein